MNGYRSFAVTVIGGNHVKSGLDLQDAVSHYNNSGVSIAVVADGHGDSDCFRSDKGAKFAVACAIRGIQHFVKEAETLFMPIGIIKKKPPPHPSHKEFNKLIREKLIKQTVASWNKVVMDNYQVNPFKEHELENVKEKYRQKFKKGESINKAYGTSLIAAAITPWYWFAYHIGDGRFSVLYPDGSGEQPVPCDEKCFLNVTTSICDDDILEREQRNPVTNDMEPAGVRSFLSFHVDRPPPIAFFLCTDGIDDNYPIEGNEKHLYRLYRTIAVTFVDDGYESTCGEDGTSGQLKELANEFATKGKDDTSIAGFIDMDTLKQVVPIWKKQIIEEALAENVIEKKIQDETEADEKGEI